MPKEIVEAMQKIREGNWALEINVKMIVASGEIGAKVMMNWYQWILDGKEMPDESITNVIVPVLKEKGHVMG